MSKKGKRKGRSERDVPPESLDGLSSFDPRSMERALQDISHMLEEQDFDTIEEAMVKSVLEGYETLTDVERLVLLEEFSMEFEGRVRRLGAPASSFMDDMVRDSLKYIMEEVEELEELEEVEEAAEEELAEEVLVSELCNDK